MSKTYGVISMDRLSTPGKTKQEIVARDLSAREAAKKAVQVARDVADSSFVVPMGSRIDNMVMVCSVSLRTKRAGSSAKRRFVSCSPIPSFKQQLRSPKKKSRKKKR